MNKYKIEYVNKSEFRILERRLKMYNMQAYKELVFNHYPNLKEGKFSGKLVNNNNNVKYYELELPCDKTFKENHGEIIVKYNVNENTKIVYIERIEPYKVFYEGHHDKPVAYKDIMVSKNRFEDKPFKINLHNILNNRNNINNNDINKNKIDIKNEIEINEDKIEKLKKLIPKKIKDVLDEIEELKKEIEELKKSTDKMEDIEDEIEYIKYELIPFFNEKEMKLYKDLRDIEENNNTKIDEIKLNLGLKRNIGFEINEEIRNSSIKKILKEFDHRGYNVTNLSKYWENNGKIELTNSYVAFILNCISPIFEKSKTLIHDIDGLILKYKFSNTYKQVTIDFEDFYKKTRRSSLQQ